MTAAATERAHVLPDLVTSRCFLAGSHMPLMKSMHFILKWPPRELNENEVMKAKLCRFCTVLHIFRGEENTFESEREWQLFCNVNWLTSYSYSTQTGSYDLAFVELAPVFFRVAAILE